MNLDQINKWLTLIANLGVLLGITVVIFELQQTQTAMQAEASTMRAQMSMDNVELTARLGYDEILERLSNGDKLTEQEEIDLSIRMGRQLRYFENLHYHWELGILDEHIWQSNLTGISRLHQNPAFLHTYPDWPDHFSANIFRKPFVDLVISFREE